MKSVEGKKQAHNKIPNDPSTAQGALSRKLVRVVANNDKRGCKRTPNSTCPEHMHRQHYLSRLFTLHMLCLRVVTCTRKVYRVHSTESKPESVQSGNWMGTTFLTRLSASNRRGAAIGLCLVSRGRVSCRFNLQSKLINK